MQDIEAFVFVQGKMVAAVEQLLSNGAIGTEEQTMSAWRGGR